MANRLISWAWEQKVSRAEKIVLVNLADRANEQGQCWPSFQRIADDCGLDRRTVIRAVANLAKRRLVSKKKRRNTSTQYVLRATNDTAPLVTHDHQGQAATSDTAPLPSDTAPPPLVTQRHPNRKGTSNEPKGPPLPPWIDPERWAEYLKVKRGKQTPYALGLVLKQLEKVKAAGADPNAALDMAIQGGWQGFRAEWALKELLPRHAASRGPPTRPESKGMVAIRRMQELYGSNGANDGRQDGNLVRGGDRAGPDPIEGPRAAVLPIGRD